MHIFIKYTIEFDLKKIFFFKTVWSNFWALLKNITENSDAVSNQSENSMNATLFSCNCSLNLLIATECSVK